MEEKLKTEQEDEISVLYSEDLIACKLEQMLHALHILEGGQWACTIRPLPQGFQMRIMRKHLLVHNNNDTLNLIHSGLWHEQDRWALNVGNMYGNEIYFDIDAIKAHCLKGLSGINIDKSDLRLLGISHNIIYFAIFYENERPTKGNERGKKDDDDDEEEFSDDADKEEEEEDDDDDEKKKEQLKIYKKGGKLIIFYTAIVWTIFVWLLYFGIYRT